jgi:hypothetical protein
MARGALTSWKINFQLSTPAVVMQYNYYNWTIPLEIIS